MKTNGFISKIKYNKVIKNTFLLMFNQLSLKCKENFEALVFVITIWIIKAEVSN